MTENETNVAPESTSPEPAKTAENETIVSSPGVPPAGAIELPQETKVSELKSWLSNELEILKAQSAAQYLQLDKRIAELVTKSAEAELPRYRPEELVIPPTAAPVPIERVTAVPGFEPHELAVGDAVKVWADPEHRTFHLGTVAAVHGEGDAFDVELEDGAVSKVPAGGLEFDDRR